MQPLMRLVPMMELTIALHFACFTNEQSDAIIRIHLSHNKRKYIIELLISCIYTPASHLFERQAHGKSG